MLYARYSYITNGSFYDKEEADRLLSINSRYKVSSVSMGGSYTTIQLEDFGDKNFNSVLFVFEDEDGREVNIYGDPVYNPRLRRNK